MLQGFPTKKGTGISIYGDYGDLANLYETVHKVANRLDDSKASMKGQSQLLMSFAYELRKAYSGQRLIEKLTWSNSDVVSYYGFNYLWTDLLFTISALRANAGYVVTDELDQANLYLLEFVTRKALRQYDSSGAAQIEEYIGKWINVGNELVFLVNQAIDIEYLNLKPSKSRFRGIPKLLSKYSTHTPEYARFRQDLEESAAQLNCKVLDIEFDGFPEILW